MVLHEIGSRVKITLGEHKGKTATVVSGTVWTYNLEHEGVDMGDRAVVIDGDTPADALRYEGCYLEASEFAQRAAELKAAVEEWTASRES